MNLSAHPDSPGTKENIPPPGKCDAFQQQQKSKPRTVLGALSENEGRGQSLSQGSQFSKCSSLTDSSQLNPLSSLSSSSYDFYLVDTSEVVLGASGHDVASESYELSHEGNPLQGEHVKLLLELSSSSCQDDSLHSERDEPVKSRETFCSDYVEDIFRNMKESEKRFRAKPDCLQRHPEITSGMRTVLVDWLAEVVNEYELTSETLHLAVNYVDRFLSRTALIRRNKLQLLGTAAILIAAKYEEIVPPELDEFVYITDSTYSKKQLLHMENVVLKVLAFKMAAITPNQFLRLFISIHHVSLTVENLALYITELSLMQTDPSLEYIPSLLGAAAYCLASYTINKSLWPESLVAFTGYTMADILPYMSNLHKLQTSAESWAQQTIRDKYKSSKLCCVAVITPPTILPF